MMNLRHENLYSQKFKPHYFFIIFIRQENMGSSLLFNPYPLGGHSILYAIKARICFPPVTQNKQ
jgi:hypothetical protein